MTTTRGPVVRTWWVAAALLLSSGVAATPPAAAQASCDGVWVVVDASALGGPVSTRCASGAPTDGLAALSSAGHQYAFVPRQPGLVCTIDHRPDPCNGAPTDAYWSYWHADGGTWTYSSRGAGNRTPPPGSADGWAFGSGTPPSQPPPTPTPDEPDEPRPPREGRPGPRPSPSPTVSPSPASPTTGSDTQDRATGGGVSPTRPSPPRGDRPAAVDTPQPTEGAGAAVAPRQRPDPDPATDDRVPDDDPEEPDTTRDPDRDGTDRWRRTVDDDEVALAVPSDGAGGSPAGLVAGGLLTGAIAGAAVWRTRRRTGDA